VGGVDFEKSVTKLRTALFRKKEIKSGIVNMIKTDFFSHLKYLDSFLQGRNVTNCLHRSRSIPRVSSPPLHLLIRIGTLIGVSGLGTRISISAEKI
jgi:hypothetical protein